MKKLIIFIILNFKINNFIIKNIIILFNIYIIFHSIHCSNYLFFIYFYLYFLFIYLFICDNIIEESVIINQYTYYIHITYLL